MGFDWDKAFGYGATGAGTGTLFGGPWGAAAGGLIGGLYGGFSGGGGNKSSLSETLTGKKGGWEQTPSMDPQQLDLLHQLMGGMGGQGGAMGAGMSYLQQLLSGSPEAMKAFEAPAMRQFNEQIIPGLMEGYSSLGAGSQSSSAFGQQMGAAGAGLAERLQAMRSGLQQQALGQLGNFMGMGLGARPFESAYRPASQGFMGGLLPSIGQGLVNRFAGGFGGNQNTQSQPAKPGAGWMFTPGYGYQRAD